MLGRVTSDTLEVATTETTSLLSGVVEGDKVCNNPFTCLEEDEELENGKTGQNDC